MLLCSETHVLTEKDNNPIWELTYIMLFKCQFNMDNTNHTRKQCVEKLMFCRTAIAVTTSTKTW